MSRPVLAKGKSVALPIESVLGVAPEQAVELVATLTPREKQVAAEMAMGIKTADIAKRLGISPKTLAVHRNNVKRKLASGTAVDVARVIYANQLSRHVNG